MYYKSIKKLPYEKWILALEGDLTAIRLNPSKGNKQSDGLAFESLLNDQIKVFGFSEHFQKVWNLKLKLAKVNQEYLKDYKNNRFLLTEIEEIEQTIKKLEETTENVSFSDVVARMLNDGRNIPNGLSVYMVEKMIRNGK